MSANAQPLRDKMIAFIREQAEENGTIFANVPYADGNWELRVYPDGYLQLGGYANDRYPEGQNLEDLNFEDLGRLVDAALA
jgi:hypothetical protein